MIAASQNQMTPTSISFTAPRNHRFRELSESENQELSAYHTSLCVGDLPQVESKINSFQFVKDFVATDSTMIRRRGNFGNGPMHLAAANGQLEIVKASAEFDPKLCLMEDLASRTPLHPAAIEGRDDVVRESVLVNQFSESLWMEEIKKFGMEELLKWEDNEGNTLLHVAASDKLIEILGRLQVSNSLRNSPLLDINSVNNKGDIALDIHYEIHSDGMFDEDTQGTIVTPGALASRPLTKCTTNYAKKTVPNIPISEINAPLGVLSAAIIFLLTICSKPPFISEDKAGSVNFWDMLIVPSKYQVIFYYMEATMVGFMVSMAGLTFLMRKLPLRMVVNFVLAVLLLTYILMANMNMPNFWIKMGTSEISSSGFMTLSAVIFAAGVFTVMIFLEISIQLSQTKEGVMDGEGAV